MSSAEVVGAGWHDTYFRWDISTPQRVVSRLQALPGNGDLNQPGKKLYAERDRFGKWQHLLGSQNVLLSYTIHMKHALIRRLEVQAHLGEDGEDDLCAPSAFDSRWSGCRLSWLWWAFFRRRNLGACGWTWASMFGTTIRERLSGFWKL